MSWLWSWLEVGPEDRLRVLGRDRTLERLARALEGVVITEAGPAVLGQNDEERREP